jgi:hypothetical protein
MSRTRRWPPERTDGQAATAAQRRCALVASILGSGIVFLDATVVNVALPSIRASLHGDLADQQWVVEAHLLTRRLRTAARDARRRER